MAGRARPTGTVSFLFTDVEGSTSAWEAEPEAMGAAVARLEEILDATADGGRRAVEQGAGDSAVLAFGRPSDAVAAAHALQLSIASEAWPTAHPLKVRAALHLGEVEVAVDGSYRGATMNRCGRMLAAAHGGQVVASGTFVSVLDESGGLGALSRDLSWVDLGRHTLRGIEAPVQVWQLAAERVESGFPPLRTPEGRGLDLPATTSSLLGRAEELDRIHDLRQSNRLVTVLGPGGSGKTRLAVEVAHAALDTVDDVHWVDLAKIGSGEAIDVLVVAELALHHGTGDPRRRLVDHLRGRRALLVLDNCEHVLPATAALVADLIESCPALSVVTTSREPLELGAEAVLRLGPLDTPTAPDGSDLLDSTAGELFAQRVARVRPDELDTDESRAAAAEICRRLDGIPLALELAAARTRSMPVEAVAERLGHRFDLLVGGRRSALARQRTLEASVAWSYDLLDPVDQAALRRLATFSGPFDLDAAAAVLDVDGRDPMEVVASLVDKSLLLEEPSGRRSRHRMLETVRFFARDRSVQADEAAMTRDRHLDWVVATVHRGAQAFEDGGSTVAVRHVDAMVEEVRAALDWARATGRRRDLVGMASDLNWYWVWRGLAGEGLRWLAEGGAVDGPIDDALRARAAFTRFHLIAHHLPDRVAQREAAREAIEAAVRAGDRDLEGRTRLVLATHLAFTDPVGQRPDVEAAAVLCREHGGPFWSAMADVHLAQSSLFRFRFGEARPHVEAAERVAVGIGNHQLAAESMSRRAQIAHNLGDLDGALRGLDDLDAALDGVATREMRAFALAAALWVQVVRGDAAGTIDRGRAAIAQYLRDEDLQFIPLLSAPLGAALIAAGDAAGACAAMAVVVEHPEVRASRAYDMVLTPPYAAAHHLAGDHDRAREIAEQARAVAEIFDSEVFGAQLDLLVGGFDLDSGVPAAAEPHLHGALEVLHANGLRQQVCDAIEEIAHLELDFGRPAAAAVLLGGAARERDAEGVVLRPWRQRVHEDTVARVRAGLGDEAASERRARGGALTLDEVVAYARRGRGERTRPTFGWDGLTDAERRVATLAAEGLTNPQIAERLVVGRETVKTHMTSVLRKLGLRNRTELARRVSDAPP